MRESGFRGKTLPGQSDVVRAVAHIGPAGLKCTSNQMNTQPERVASVARPRVDEGESPWGWHSRGSSSGKRAIVQTPNVAARSVTELIQASPTGPLRLNNARLPAGPSTMNT